MTTTTRMNDDQITRVVRTIIMHEGRTRDIHQDYTRVMDTLKFNYGEAANTKATRQIVVNALQDA